MSTSMYQNWSGPDFPKASKHNDYCWILEWASYLRNYILILTSVSGQYQFDSESEYWISGSLNKEVLEFNQTD